MRKPRSAEYREAWALIEEWAACRVTCTDKPVKFGEAAGGGNPEPSRGSERVTEGVETSWQASRYLVG